MLQLEYACSLYFNPVQPFTTEGLQQNFQESVAAYPHIFQNYDLVRYKQVRVQHNRAFRKRRIKRQIGQTKNLMASIVGRE